MEEVFTSLVKIEQQHKNDKEKMTQGTEAALSVINQAVHSNNNIDYDQKLLISDTAQNIASQNISMKKEINDLRNDGISLQNQLSAILKERNELEQDIETLKLIITQKEQNEQSSKHEIAVLKADNQTQKIKIQQLSVDNHSLQQNLQSEKQNIYALNSTIHNIDKILQTLKSKTDSMNLVVTEQGILLQQKQLEIDKLQNNLQAEKTKNLEFEGVNAGQKSVVQAFAQENTKQRKELDTIKQLHSQFTQQINQLQQEYQQLKQKDLSEIAQLKDQNSQLIEKMNQLQQEYRQFVSNAQAQELQLQEEIHDKMLEFQKLNEHYLSEHMKLQEKTVENARLVKEIELLKATIIQLNEVAFEIELKMENKLKQQQLDLSKSQPIFQLQNKLHNLNESSQSKETQSEHCDKAKKAIYTTKIEIPKLKVDYDIRFNNQKKKELDLTPNSQMARKRLVNGMKIRNFESPSIFQPSKQKRPQTQQFDFKPRQPQSEYFTSQNQYQKINMKEKSNIEFDQSNQMLIKTRPQTQQFNSMQQFPTQDSPLTNPYHHINQNFNNTQQYDFSKSTSQFQNKEEEKTSKQSDKKSPGQQRLQ